MSATGSSRRDFLRSVGLGIAALGVLGASDGAAGDRKPDILFVQTDYQRGVDGPLLGSPFLKMPAFDRLCREGAVFARHISTSPICMPARFCWVTGQYPHTHGQWDNANRPWPEGSPMRVELLQRLGYNTVGVGKMHFCPWDRMIGFDRRIIAEGRGNPAHDDYDRFLNTRGLSRRDLLRIQGKFGLVGDNAVYDWPHDELLYIDNYVGDQGRRVIERGEWKAPGFMWVSFPGPHNPWNPPARYAAPYLERADLPLGSTFPGELRMPKINRLPGHFSRTPFGTRHSTFPPLRETRIGPGGVG